MTFHGVSGSSKSIIERRTSHLKCRSVDPDPLTHISMNEQARPASRILVVEDDVPTADMLVMMLEGEGYSVCVAPTVESALDLLASPSPLIAEGPGDSAAEPPDLLLLDLKLPDHNGSEVIARLRSAGQVAPPVIVLSALQEPVVERVATAIGARLFLTKPFTMEVLLGSIAATLDQSPAG
jgi:DNA-binding response OmpR family regulator